MTQPVIQFYHNSPYYSIFKLLAVIIGINLFRRILKKKIPSSKKIPFTHIRISKLEEKKSVSHGCAYSKHMQERFFLKIFLTSFSSFI